MKFKIGTSVRVKVSAACEPGLESLRGVAATVVGYDDQYGRCGTCLNDTEWHELDFGPQEAAACACVLERSLPDSDTYHPADISIDDLMRSIRETEHV